jgi:hypothetical protein
VRIGRTPVYLGAERSKLHFTVLSIDMMFMECGALADDVARGAHNHGVKTAQTAFAHLENKKPLLHKGLPITVPRCRQAHECTSCSGRPIGTAQNESLGIRAYRIVSHETATAVCRNEVSNRLSKRRQSHLALPTTDHTRSRFIERRQPASGKGTTEHPRV